MSESGDDDQEMFCPACGERISRSAKFCRYCGEPNRKTKGEDAPSQDSGTQEPPAAAESDESQEPWETPYARRVESRIEDDETEQTDEPTDSDSAWRDRLPDAARDPDESTLRVVGIAAGLGLLGVGLLVVITVLTVNIGSALGIATTPLALLGTVLGQYLGFIGLSIYYLRNRGFDKNDITTYLGVRWPTLRELGLVIAAWVMIFVLLIVIGLAIEAVTELLGSGNPDEPDQALDEVISANPAILIGVIVAMFVVVGPSEEILFRGIVQGRLRERLSAVPAIALASLLFASIHVIALAGSLQAIVLGISVLFVTSLVLGAVYEYTGSIVIPALLHAFHNSMVTIFVYIQVTTDVEEGILVELLLGLPW
jgi:membrane protease YdiL (CAAX protease family)